MRRDSSSSDDLNYTGGRAESVCECYAVSYRGLEHLQISVSVGVLESTPETVKGQVSIQNQATQTLTLLVGHRASPVLGTEGDGYVCPRGSHPVLLPALCASGSSESALHCGGSQEQELDLGFALYMPSQGLHRRGKCHFTSGFGSETISLELLWGGEKCITDSCCLIFGENLLVEFIT